MAVLNLQLVLIYNVVQLHFTDVTCKFSHAEGLFFAFEENAPWQAEVVIPEDVLNDCCFFVHGRLKAAFK